MTTPNLPRRALTLSVLLAALGRVSAVEPVDYERAPHLLRFWPTDVECVVVKSIRSATFGLTADGDVYVFDPTTAPGGPGPILSNTGATDLDVWEDSDSILLNVPGAGVRIIDVSNTQNPQDIQTIPVSSPAVGVGDVVDLGQGSIRYVSGGPTILYSFVLDFPNAPPADLRTGLVSSAVLDLVGHEDHVFGATAAGVIHAEPAQPGEYSVTITDNTITNDITINDSGNLLAAAQGAGGTAVYVLDGDGTITTQNTIPGNSLSVSIRDSKLVTSDGKFTFSFDVTNPNDPIPGAVVRTEDLNDMSLVDTDSVNAGCANGAMKAFLAGNPIQPIAEYIFALPSHVESDRTQPGIVFTANSFVIESFDFNDPNSPQSLDFHAISNVSNFQVRDGLAFATQTGGGFNVLDVSDPSDINLLTFLGLTLVGFMDVTPSGDCAMLGGFNLVMLLDLTDPSNPVARDSFSFDGPVVDLLLNDSIAVVFHTTAVTVLDISDKTNIVELERFEDLAGIFGLQRSSADDFMVHRPGAVERIDAQTGNAIGRVDVPIGDSGVIEGVDEVLLKAPGECYYLTDEEGTILVLDWTDPAQPRIVGEISDPAFAPKILTVTNNTLVIFEDVGPGQLSMYPAHGRTVTAAPTRSAVVGPTLLRSVYPNPMGVRSHILMEMPFGAVGSLAIYDLRGRRVRMLFEGHLPIGSRLLSWDGRDDRGLRVAAGLYFVRAAFDDRTESRPVTVVR